MSRKLIIKDVVLCRPIGAVDSGYDMNGNIFYGKIMVEFENIKTETCVIDEERGKVISIETREVYDFVRRDSMDRITSHGIDKMKQHEIIALRLIDKDWDKISMLYQIVLKARAKEVFESYIKRVTKEEKGKSYTKRDVNK